MRGNLFRELYKRAAFPGSEIRSGEFAVRSSLVRGDRLEFVASELGERVGFVLRTQDNSSNPRILIMFLGGNNMTAEHTLDIRDRIEGLGYAVIVPDYVGFGVSSGEPSESGCIRAAQSALFFAEREVGIAPSDVVVIGWSLGSVIATAVASNVQLRGLVLISPILSAASTVFSSERFAKFPIIGRGPLSIARSCGAVRVPSLVICGAADKLSKPWMARRVVDLLGSQAEYHSIRASHNDILLSGDCWHLIGSYLAGLARFGVQPE